MKSTQETATVVSGFLRQENQLHGRVSAETAPSSDERAGPTTPKGGWTSSPHLLNFSHWDFEGSVFCQHTFSAFWLRSSVVSVLVSVTTDTSYIVRLRTSLQFFVGEADTASLLVRLFSCRADFSLLLRAATLWGTLIFVRRDKRNSCVVE